ncbi:MAG: FtsX-like permease family protein [Treponema sp.]|jgi:ABC-type lipoprotein release transport system permease subunit|nr:FtsX-like permease family protein [Treponema sp.]
MIRMAFRNLARHKVKTVLSILAIAVSVAVYIFADAWIAGMTVDSKRNIVSYETGAAKLQARLYFENLDDRPMYENFGGWEGYAGALDRAGYVSSPRFVFAGTLFSETGSAPVIFNAIDPRPDSRVLRIDSSVENGRYLREGAFEIILGTMTADKLKLGIPMRPTRKELEELISALPPGEGDFVRALYERAGKKPGGLFAPKAEPESGGNGRLFLRRDVSPADRDRYWNMLAEAGRMNARISTVIDLKAAPGMVRQERFESDLEPKFSAGEAELFRRAYEYDELTRAWYLAAGDPALTEEVLAAMVRADYSGAVRHVNQLIDVVLAGTINAPNPQLNNNTAFIPIDVLQDEAGLMLEGKVTELVIRRQNAGDTALPGKYESPSFITAALEAELGRPLPPELGIFGWEGYVKDFIAAAAGDNWSTRIMTLILFVLSFLGIANTMLLAILERTREIGMMRAQGMSDARLVFTLTAEAGMAGLIGSLAGLALGCLINIPMVKYGIDFSAMTETMGGDIGYRVNGVFRSAWNGPVIIGSAAAATLIAASMALLPALGILKTPLTESLRDF